MLFAIVVRRLHRLKSWRRRRYGSTLPAEVNDVTAVRGDIITLLEPDYQYGVGPLRLRVECVDKARPIVYEGEYWYPVDGVQLGADGTEMRRRQVLVRGSRLRG